jgi:hypothetical protein
MVTQRGEHSQLLRRVEVQTEVLNPEETIFTPGGQSSAVGAKLKTDFWSLVYLDGDYQDHRRKEDPEAGAQEGEETFQVRTLKYDLRAILNFTPGPQGWISPLGVNLSPRGEICPLGVKFPPLFTPRGEHSLLFRRMEGQTENFTPRG